ncbi:MAG: tRNA (N(6)-L-threonylcarbamoyladenosine(37)-C(2))-methylthiotransferase MtaB [Melioribacteraceae bacterium]|nr:tRNA (N(6)-L-threonylcarbamoyladenosine(37)-C(2))-methylthiotransferase MtaB [Melioribacteraceae bacterium]MCF8265308.1 tRNA (N(6)-L-threonylcarbamoyladenosine(37)-C(2))-methylthiotransferase MtaB [Melioribacteraceae bacterium]
MPKVAFYTLGCKLNFSETSSVGEQFLNSGFDLVEFDKNADVYVVNTCTVTENAEKDCRNIVRKALRQNPNAYIAVTGCYAQLRPEEISKIEGVDAVFGSNEKFDIINIAGDFQKQDLSCIHVSPTEELNSFHSAHSTEADSRTRAFFKVQDGCDYKCSFCTIPLARGKSRSLEIDKTVTQFKGLLDQGYKEIILTGVNVGDYGKSFGTDFYQLLVNLLKIEGEFRLRISSIEPNLLTDEIIELVKNDPRLCNHFHIPLQSGSSKILQLMRRRYKTNDYKDLVSKAVERIRDLGIGVDVIVGFPGETEDDFMETYNFIKDLPIMYLHVFTYSERPDTDAISYPATVDIRERKRRNNMLRILSEKKRSVFNKLMVGKELDVLFESEEKDGLIFGFASNYVRVQVPFDADLINQFVKVKIKGANGKICTAEVIKNTNLSTNIAV